MRNRPGHTPFAGAMQSQFVLFSLLAIAALFAVDLYVYRRWRRFAQTRQVLRWTVPFFGVLMVLMPFVMPVYALTSRWWSVEPRLVRWAVVAFWLVYYVPRFVVALALLLLDAALLTRRLFAWFRLKLLYEQPRPASDAPDAPRLDLSDMRTMNRAEFLRTMGWSAGALPFVAVGYSVFRQLYDFDVRRVTVPVPDLPPALDGVTIAQLSDLHAGSLFSSRPMQDAVDLTLGLKPDLVALTGDFVNSSINELPTILPDLARLSAPLGVYGCLGNHDHYTHAPAVAERIGAAGVQMLVNAHQTLRVDGAALHVVGTDNTGFRQHFADLDRATAGLPAPGEDESVRLLLAHDPTFWDTEDGPRPRGFDLMLAGHTHGGQIGFEWGPLRWSLARSVYRRWAGLYAEPGERGTQHLYVNRGLGTVGPPLRLGIRPEITLLALVRA